MENTESGDTVASSAIHTEGNEETAEKLHQRYL